MAEPGRDRVHQTISHTVWNRRGGVPTGAAAAVILAVVSAGGTAAAQMVLPSPLQPMVGGVSIPGLTLGLELDLETYARLHRLQEPDRVHIAAFSLDLRRAVDLELERFEVLAPDAKLVVADGMREANLPRPNVVLLRGEVSGVKSSVYLALSPHGSHGFISLEEPGAEQMYIISTPPEGAAIDGPWGAAVAAPTVIYNQTSLPDGVIDWLGFTCGVGQLVHNAPRRDPGRLIRGGHDGSLPCRRVRVAVETDWEYASVFGGESSAALAYTSALMGASNSIFQRDVNVRLEVVYTRIWPGPNDPYSTPNIDQRLSEFQEHWNTTMQGVDRHVAHMLSGLRAGSGGVAWGGAACGTSTSYGISGYINGAFPFPLVNNHSQNWDVMVVTHEIAHNFDAPHTHEMTPPIDRCGHNICSGANQGTIMSYCHTCSGGMSNIRLDLHHRVVNERMAPYLDSLACGHSLSPVAITQQPSPATIIGGQSVEFTAQADGTGPRSYRWMLNDVAITNGIAVSGATSPTLTILSGDERHAGEYRVRITNTCGEVISEPARLTVLKPCYANCDQSTAQPILNVADFTCFINEFSQAQTLPVAQQVDHYANCDGSTVAPVLTVNDFACFVNQFAAGCP